MQFFTDVYCVHSIYDAAGIHKMQIKAVTLRHSHLTKHNLVYAQNARGNYVKTQHARYQNQSLQTKISHSCWAYIQV